ncbi:MAG: alpha/beta hydrolase [Alphaproteobacteria bacterium]|tara:strand:+ start:1726 stop:3294 length:1569 start_codon:yes stop_codon:yes gene_type:complete
MTRHPHRNNLPEAICYDLSFNGRRIGTSWAVASSEGPREVTLTCFQWMAEVPTIGLQGFRKRSVYRLSRKGLLLEATIEDSNGGTVHIKVSRNGLTINGRRRVLDHPVDFVLEPNQFSLVALQLALRGRFSEHRAHAMIPDTGTTLPVTLTCKGDVIRSSFNESMTIGPDGLISSVAFASPESAVHRAQRPIPRWTTPLCKKALAYSPPDDISVRDVEIVRSDYDAGATVARPKAPSNPMAVALFVGGTGIYNRHGLTSRMDIGTHYLLDGLARCGVASVRYDKFNRQAATIADAQEFQDFHSLCHDTNRWLNWLDSQTWAQNLPRIIIGHSLGGLIALSQSAARDDLRAVVTLNTPGRSLRSVTDEQHAWFQTHLAVTPPTKLEATRKRQALLGALEQDDAWTEETVPGDLLALKNQRRLLKSLLDLDPANLVHQGTAPLLVIQGERDMQVTMKDARLLLSAADEAGRPAKLIKAAGLDHHLKRNNEKGMAAFRKYMDRRRRIPRDLIQTIAKEIKSAVSG